MSEAHFFRIGTLGEPWTDAEKQGWKAEVGTPIRSYKEEVLNKLEPLRAKFDIEQYGALSIDSEKTQNFPEAGEEKKDSKPCILVTGGVHGYEKSGVQGALMFAEKSMSECSNITNNQDDKISKIVTCVCPCVSPWGYECIQRWSFTTQDPNRSFFDTPESSLCEEGAALVKLVQRFGLNIPERCLMHVDLHETTDTDASEFRPAKAARDGETTKPNTHIPDGFYLVGDTDSANCEKNVREVTHIAPPDAEGNILGEVVRADAEGTITLPTRDNKMLSKSGPE